MRVLIYTSEYPPFKGGAGTYTEDLAVGLGSLGHEVIVMAPYYAQTYHDEEVIRVIRKRGFLGKLKGAWDLYQAIKRWEPDVIHITTHKAQKVAAWLLFFFRFPYFMTVHGAELLWNFGPHFRIR